MRIMTKGTVKVDGEHYPPDRELEVSAEVAEELVAAGAAEILDQNTASEETQPEPQDQEPEAEPAPVENGVDPALLRAVRTVLAAAGDNDSTLLTQDGRPKVGAVEDVLGRKPGVEEIQTAMEAIEAEERR